MTGKLADSLFERLIDVSALSEELLVEVSSSGLTTILLALLFLVLLRRHNLLSYGTEQETWLSEGFLLLGLYLVNKTTGLTWLSVVPPAILCVLSSGAVLHSYALKRSPFFAFHVGLGVAILTVVHPIYILLIPFLLFKFSQLRQLTPKHISATVLAIVAVWYLSILFFAPPHLMAMKQYFLGRITLLLRPELPSGKLLYFWGGIFLILLTFTVKVYHLIPRSIARHKWVLLFQISMSWLTFAMSIAYGIKEGSFLAVTVLYLASTLRHISSDINNRDNSPSMPFWIFLTIGIVVSGTGLFIK